MVDELTKKERLEIIKGFKKTYKSIMWGKEVAQEKVEVIPSGSLGLDIALGIGGYPKGSLIDIYGAPNGGKTLLSMMAIRELQKIGGLAAIIDAERNFFRSKAWLEINGVKTDELVMIYPKYGEEALDILYKMMSEKAVDLIVVDSVPSLIPKSSLERDLEEGSMIGERARMWTNGLSKLSPMADDSNVAVMLINQLRANIGHSKYESSTDSTGGMALKHFCSLRIEVSKIGSEIVDEKKTALGHRIKTKIHKNKFAPPLRFAEFNIFYESGIDKADELASLMVKTDVITQEGSWFIYKEQKYHGLEKIKPVIMDNYDAVKKEVLDILKNKKADVMKLSETEIAKDTAEGKIGNE